MTLDQLRTRLWSGEVYMLSEWTLLSTKEGFSVFHGQSFMNCPLEERFQYSDLSEALVQLTLKSGVLSVEGYGVR